MKSSQAKKIVAALLLCVAVFAACNKNESEPRQNDFDRKAMLQNAADNIIIPAYTNFQSELAELEVAVQLFTGSPDEEKLSGIQAKWRDAYVAWQQVELFNFGPAESVSLRNYFNIYPTDINLLNSHVQSGTYNLEELSSNKVQGFPALDYLINGAGSNNSEIVALYTTDANAANYRKYLTDVLAIMKTKTDGVRSEWDTYKQTFVESDGTGAGSSTSLMVNEFIMHFERFVRSGKFAIPAGVMSGVPAPEKVEAFYSKQLGVTLAKIALKALSDFYMGKAFSGGQQGPGLHTYLLSLGTNNQNITTLDANIQSQFGVIETKINSLGNSVYDAIVNNRQSVLELYDEFQTQVRYLKVDMTSAMGLTITYTDNDGD